MQKTIRARYSRGVIRPLEELEIEEGKELTITVFEVPDKVEGEDPFDVTSGGWSGLIDADELKRNIYRDRLIATRPPADL